MVFLVVLRCCSVLCSDWWMAWYFLVVLRCSSVAVFCAVVAGWRASGDAFVCLSACGSSSHASNAASALPAAAAAAAAAAVLLIDYLTPAAHLHLERQLKLNHKNSCINL